MTRKPRRWPRPSASAPVTSWWRTEKEAKDILGRARTSGEDFAALAKQYSLDGSEAIMAAIWVSSRRPKWCRIRRRGLRAEGRRNLAAGEDPFRLAHHQAGRPRSRARPSPMIRSKSAIRNVLLRRKVQEAMDKIRAAVEGRDRRRGSEEMTPRMPPSAAKRFAGQAGRRRPVRPSTRLRKAAMRRPPPARAISSSSSRLRRPRLARGLSWRHPVSPLAPERFPELPPIAGVRLATGEPGIRYKNRTDVLLARLATRAPRWRACFTTIQVALGPGRLVPRQASKGGKARAARRQRRQRQCLHRQGGRGHGRRPSASAAARRSACKPREIFLASTGVIGEPLTRHRSPPRCRELLARGAAGRMGEAARAIMTTDTFPKAATATAKLDGGDGHHQRHRQGLGHDRARHGDDAGLHLHRCDDRRRRSCRSCCRAASASTFNCITVDSDTSTSDTVLLFATGAAGQPARRRHRQRDAASQGLRQGARRACCIDLAHAGGARRRRRDEADRDRASPAPTATRRRTASPCRSPIRRW